MKELALAQGDESQQRRFLLSDAVQNFLESAATSLLCNSLDAERALGMVKQREARRISLVSTISRDVLCRQFTHWRETNCREVDKWATRLRKLKNARWNSIAWQQLDSDLRPLGLRITSETSRSMALGGSADRAHHDSPDTIMTTPQKRGNKDSQAHSETKRLKQNARVSKPSAAPTVSSVKSRGSKPSAAPTGSSVESRGSKPSAALTNSLVKPRGSKPSAAPTGTSVKPPTPEEKARFKAELEERRACALGELRRAQQATTFPVTREQWSAWLESNISEFRSRMSKAAAPARRAILNNRVMPMPGLAKPDGSFQPKHQISPLSTEWAKLLDGRSGWHGIQTECGRRMFFLLRHLRHTYVIDLEQYRVIGDFYPYHVDKTFEISGSEMLLSEFEHSLRKNVVHNVYEFTIVATTDSSPNILLKPSKVTEITECLQPISDKTDEVDSCEELGDDMYASDLESDAQIVDTDSDIATSGTSSAVSSDWDGGVDVADAGPASGGPAGESESTADHGSGGPSIWDNGYFHMKGNEFDLKMFIHNKWRVAPPTGLGCYPTMTKTITPSTKGETRDNPRRTTLLLKAWMIWRCRNVTGWIDATPARKRLFDEEVDQLFRDLCRLQPQSDGVLGNASATSFLKKWMPDLVDKLQAEPSIGGAGG